MSSVTAKSASSTSRKPSISTDSVSLLIRSATSGIAASSTSCCSAVGGSETRPAAARYGTERRPISSTESSRMCAALMASAFFMSNRAGLGFTSPISNAATISSMEKMSRSPEIAQPSRAR